MISAIFASQRPAPRELIRTLDANPQVAGDAVAKVMNGLVALTRSSTFFRYAMTRFSTAVRVVQLLFRRILARNKAMRQRGLQEWQRKELHAIQSGNAANIRRAPNDDVRRRVIEDEFAMQRKQFAVIWKVWRKTQVSLELQLRAARAEYDDAASRPGRSLMTQKSLQDRIAFLIGRLQHHDGVMPLFRGMEINVTVLSEKVAAVVRVEASERVSSAMWKLGVKSEDPKFLEMVTKRYEEVLEAKTGKRSSTRKSTVEKVNITGKRASTVRQALVDVPQPPLQVSGDVRVPTAPTPSRDMSERRKSSQRHRLVQFSPAPPSNVTILEEPVELMGENEAPVEATASTSLASVPLDTFSLVAAPHRQRHANVSVTPSKTKARAPAASEISAGDLPPPVPTIDLVTPRKASSSQPVPLSPSAPQPPLSSSSVGTPQRTTTEKERKLYSMLGVPLEELRTPISENNRMFKQTLKHALAAAPLPAHSPRQGLPISQSVQDNSEPSTQAQNVVACHVSSEPVMDCFDDLVGSTAPKAPARKIVIKPLPVVSIEKPHIPKPLPIDPRENKCYKLRKSLSPSSRRRMFHTIASKAAATPGDAAETSPPRLREDILLVPKKADKSPTRRPVSSKPMPRMPTPPDFSEHAMFPSRPETPLLDKADDAAQTAEVLIDDASLASPQPVATTSGDEKGKKSQPVAKTMESFQAQTFSSGTVALAPDGTVYVQGIKVKDFCAKHCQLTPSSIGGSSPSTSPSKGDSQGGARSSISNSIPIAPLLPFGSFSLSTRAVTVLCFIDAEGGASGKEEYVAAACSDGTLRISSLRTMATVFVDCPPSRDGLSFLCVCDHYLCAGGEDNHVYLFEFSDTCAERGGGRSGVFGATTSIVAKNAVANRRSSTIFSQQSDSSPPLASTSHGVAKQQSLHGSPSSSAVATSKWQYVGKLRQESSITSMIPLGATRFIAVSSYESSVLVWNVVSQTQLMSLEGHAQGVAHLMVTRSTAKLVSSSFDGTVKLWTISGEASPREAKRVNTESSAGAFSEPSIVFCGEVSLGGAATAHDEQGTADGDDIDVSYSDTPYTVATFAQHRAAVMCAVEVHNNRILSTISKDNTIRIWDQVTLETMCTIPNVPGHLFTAMVAFPRNTAMVVGLNDGRALLFSTETGKLIHSFDEKSHALHAVVRLSDEYCALCYSDGSISVVSIDRHDVVARQDRVHNGTISCGISHQPSKRGANQHITTLLITGGEDRAVNITSVPLFPKYSGHAPGGRKSSASASMAAQHLQ